MVSRSGGPKPCGRMGEAVWLLVPALNEGQRAATQGVLRDWSPARWVRPGPAPQRCRSAPCSPSQVKW